MKIECTCCWCGTKYESERKRPFPICGKSACYKGFHRTRHRDYPGMSAKEFAQVLKNLLAEFRHPNKQHPSNDPSNPARIAYEIETMAYAALNELCGSLIKLAQPSQ